MKLKTTTSLTMILTSLGLLQANAQDYNAYNDLLKKYAHPTGVDYKTWHKSRSDQKTLDKILAEWAKVDADKLEHKDKAAFRINLYNASMIDAALEHYPLESVTKIGEPFSIFDKKFIKTPDGHLSLNILEKKTLLRDFPDARVHFSVNCGSESCPPLRSEAFRGAELEKQLTEQATLFSNSSRAAQIHGSTVKYSELFNWYEKDFKTKNPATYLNNYRTSKIDPSSKIEWIKYDWSLNQSE